MTVTEPLFVSEDGCFVPTELARGPWSPDALHGGPVGALLARDLERHEVDAPVHVTRVTMELLRPVPVEPLAVATRTLRPGKKVQLVESVLVAGDREVARAVALRIRAVDTTVPDTVAGDDPPPAPLPAASDGAGAGAGWPWRAFHHPGMELRFAVGRFDDEGPAVAWLRLPRPVVDDEPVTPVQRVMAAADFGNGVSRVLTFDWLFVNPDLTVHLYRPPVGEWVCLDARTFVGTQGAGVAESALYDERGRVGRSVQSLVIEPR